MSTLTTPKKSASAEARRIINVTKLHFTNAFPMMVLPLLILGFIFLVNYVIWLLIFTSIGASDAADVSEGMQFSGASLFIFVYMLVVAVQAVNLTFPFALGYGVTRRDFYLGSSVAFILLSFYFAAIMAILATIERATNGWGLGGHMFDVVYFGADDIGTRFVLYLFVFLFFFFIGAATASVYVRWKSNGMIAFFAVLTLIVLGAIVLITQTQSWPAVGEWFVTNGSLGVAAWSLLLTAAAAVAGFFLMRRATPKA
ncbi:ABC transporter permease [Homoserinimonas hongtaonis]|uniref:ABC transporter permease n=1 Tax=Homoserinimonas hongtaonis TaxID=2079791 RepID=UPI000D39DBC3|nr:ABC transporter permease [Salinibacterium hongtaonis]AWB88794.1 ABC transporter permease [Salinibacterium hongtaonis]